MFLLCYRHHCDDFWSLINFLHWSLSLKQYFKFSQPSNYFDITTMPTMHKSYFISRMSVCYSLTAGLLHMASQVSGARVTHSEGVRPSLSGNLSPGSVILWLIFIVSSILTQIQASWWSLLSHRSHTPHTTIKARIRSDHKHKSIGQRPQGWLETPNMSTASQHLRFWEPLG